MFKNEKYNIFFSVWLIGLITLVASIIIVGGLTRLTDSGLSITKWEVFKGILPPLNEAQWEKYFSEYKSIPQYVLLNTGMSLEEFKIIFYWEYFHRILGRLIGLIFFIPFIFLLYKKILNKYLIIRLVFLSILILLQGFIGWFMVKSGLVDNVSVSHFRLSLHLTTAFIIFSSLIWLFMNHYYQMKKNFMQINSEFIFLKILLFLIFLQIVVGAFVSGLDAGKIYQTWPLMNGNYFPSDDFLNNLFNFKDPSFVQFIHRNIAYVIFGLSIYTGVFIYKKKITELYNSYLFFIFFIAMQILLGILVLYSNVNIYFASLHQISSIFLIVSSLFLYYRSIKTE
jgi:cytochrome c oxidase assembly protein subunit 15|tara:strand:+ start:6921 stop:7940 length:1020 start_codon:yes stop_codon:yes gene_type:complete